MDNDRYNLGVKPGDRIRLVNMPQDPNPIPAGTCGTVTAVNDMQIQVDWDIARSLSLVPDVDVYERMPVEGRYYEVHFHGQIEDGEGLTADHGGNPTSWCVYVREYAGDPEEDETIDTWDTLEEVDFETPEEASAFAGLMAKKYDAGIDEF